MSVCRERFHVFATGGGCTGFIVHEKYRVVVWWGCLRFLFRPSFATVRCSAIYRDIPTWVPRCRCYVSVTVGGATATDGTVSLQSA